MVRMNSSQFHLRTRRAVDTIIAVMLLIAIGIVGGIMIFVLSSQFFENTTIQVSTRDSIEIFGYDARDAGNIGSPACAATALVTHNGICMTGATNTADNVLDSGDNFFLFVQNNGRNQVLINSIEVRGNVYTPVETGTVASGDTVPGDAKFCVTTPITTAGSGTCTFAVIEGGDARTIVVGYEDANVDVGDIALRDPIQVKVVTGSGKVVTIVLQNGVVRGVT